MKRVDPYFIIKSNAKIACAFVDLDQSNCVPIQERGTSFLTIYGFGQAKPVSIVLVAKHDVTVGNNAPRNPKSYPALSPELGTPARGFPPYEASTSNKRPFELADIVSFHLVRLAPRGNIHNWSDAIAIAILPRQGEVARAA